MEVHVSTNRLVIHANALLNITVNSVKQTMTIALMIDPNAITVFALILLVTVPILQTLNVSATWGGKKMAMESAHVISTNV